MASFDQEARAPRAGTSSTVNDGPLARFLRGENDDKGAVSALTNDEFGVLFGLLREDDEDSEVPETEELGELLPLSSESKAVRRSKREVAEFFSKHATKRKLSSQEMANFLESKRKKRKAYRAILKEQPSSKFPSVPDQSELKPSVLQHQRKVWKDFCGSCNSYDLDGLQRWMERSLSPSMAFRIKSDQLPDMSGSIYFIFYIAVILGAFPACFFDYDVSGDAPEEETHVRLLAWAQQSASPAFSFLSQEQTSCFRLQVKFDGFRICFHSLWDVMSSYMQRTSLLKSGPLSGNEMHEFLHGDDSIYSDFIRESDGSRSDGQTSCQVNVDILIDNESLLIIAFDMVTCEMLSCPPLDDLDDDAFR